MIQILELNSDEVQNALRRRKEFLQKRGLSLKDGKEYSGNYKGTSSKRKREIYAKMDELKEEIDKLYHNY